MERNNRQLQQRLAIVEQEVQRLRALNEKISLSSVNNTPSPGDIKPEPRPLSPPPESSMPQSQLATVSAQDAPHEDSSPSASENGL